MGGITIYYSLEHFEKDTAVLQDESEQMVTVDRSLLPSEATTGDIFVLENGVYRYEHDETQRRKARILSLEQLLRDRQRRD